MHASPVVHNQVTGIMEFGCFVELNDAFRQKAEGLVHVSNITTARASTAKGLVERGQEVRKGGGGGKRLARAVTNNSDGNNKANTRNNTTPDAKQSNPNSNFKNAATRF